MKTHLLLPTLLALALATGAFAEAPVYVPPASLPGTAAPAPSPIFQRPSSLFSLGLGLGPQYGEGGANVEYHALSQVSLTGAYGLNGDNNWMVGTRVYLKPEGKGTRARITVGVATDSGSPAHAFASVGGTWGNAANDYRGFDIDITTDGTISAGYHF